MNKAAGIAAVLVIGLCVIGCGRFGGGSATGDGGNANANSNAEPSRAKMAVDITPLVGKSIDEIKKVLGPPSGELAGRFRWEFPQGDLAAETNYKDKTKNKVDYLEFSAKVIVVGGQAAQGYPDYERMGDLIGLDMRGKTPTATAKGDTDDTTFEKYQIGSTTVDRITFNKVSGNYRSVIVEPVRGR